MALLKEDGSLDIEKINKLPLEEYMKAIGSLTQEQYQDYLSKIPITESNEPVKPVIVDYTLEEDKKMHGTVDAFEFLDEMRRKYERENDKI